MANQLDFRVKNGLIVGGDTNITGAITSVDSIQLDTAVAYVAPVEGQLKWHEDEGSFAIGLDGSIVADLPETTLYRVTNNTASTIPKGTLVASVGTTGNSGKIVVSAWNPATQTPVQIMGITTGQILSGGDGHVTHFGKIRGIQTNGGNYSEVWVNGDILYAGPNGGLTKTVPTAPSTKTIIAIVISSHASNGTLFVRPSLSSSIANDDLVQLTSIANGDMLVYNSTAGRFENSKTLQPGMVISGSSTNDALRITQTGTGNALVVEDSANPDASPFVINASGQLLIGTSTLFPGATAGSISILSEGSTTPNGNLNGRRYSNDIFGLFWGSGKARGNFASPVIVNDGDDLGYYAWQGYDGTTFHTGAQIQANVDGTPGTNSMPGRLSFYTTANGNFTATERVRITNDGKTGFATSAPAATVHVSGSTILSNVNVIGASYDNVSFDVSAEDTAVTGLFFSPDGLKMYVIGSGVDNVNEYNLTTAWEVSSAVFSTSFKITSQDGAPVSIVFRADGTKMYMLGSTNDAVYQYTLSTPWSVATASYDNISFYTGGQDLTPQGMSFKSDGTSMYMVGSTAPDSVYQYTLSTAWDVSTATFLQSLSITGQEASPTGVTFTGDGSRMFVVGVSGDDVTVYNLTTPWDISTAATIGSFSVFAQDGAAADLYIKPDGTKMYILGNTLPDKVYQYTVPSIDIQLTGPTSAAALDVQQDLNVYGNITGSFRNNGFKENIGGQYYNLVSQSDIGTSPNEIPLNQYLGNLAYQDAESIAGPVGIGGNLTLNAGTANSVAYLNGSKVLTTGSALTFDGSNLGIANSSPLARLQVEELGIDTTTSTAGIGDAGLTIYSVAAANFRTIEVMIQITQGSNYHSTKMFILHNSTDVWFNQTNVLHTGSELGTFNVDISSGNVRVLYYPTSTATASTIKVGAIMMAV